MILPLPWTAGIAAGALLAGAAGGWWLKGRDCAADAAEARIEAENERAERQAEANTEATDYEVKRDDYAADNREREVEIRTVYRDRVIRPECALAARSVLQAAVDRANADIAGGTGEAVRAHSKDAGARREP